MSRFILAAVCAAVLLLTQHGIASADDWPIFLGPHGTGITTDAGISDHWPAAGPPIVWNKRIGTGYSSPSIRDGKLVVHHRLRNSEIVECLNATSGTPIWKNEYPSEFRDPYGYNNGPRCTPLLAGDRCYTFGAEGKLLCVELATGKKIWERNTAKDFYVPQHFFGVGCTPILEGDLLIVLVGGQPNAGVVAYRSGTGEPVWQSVGKDTWDGIKTDWPTEPTYRWTGNEMVVSYSSPLAATIHGKRHLSSCLMRQGLVSVDPANGHVNFKYWFCSRDYESVTAARPVVIGDKIFVTAAYKVGSALLQVDPSGQSVKELCAKPEQYAGPLVDADLSRRPSLRLQRSARAGRRTALYRRGDRQRRVANERLQRRRGEARPRYGDRTDPRPRVGQADSVPVLRPRLAHTGGEQVSRIRRARHARIGRPVAQGLPRTVARVVQRHRVPGVAESRGRGQTGLSPRREHSVVRGFVAAEVIQRRASCQLAILVGYAASVPVEEM